MPNDFSGDAAFVAVYNFESGALTADSKGSNTLTPSGSPPTEDETNYWQGACSALFTAASGQYYKITDANLPSGWPFKSDDASQKFSCAFWWKQVSNQAATYRYFVAKYGASTPVRTFAVSEFGTRLKIFLRGTTTNVLDTGIDLLNGEVYHIGVSIDGADGTVNVRVWRVSNSTVYTYTFSTGDPLQMTAADFSIGARSDYTAGTFIDGNSDELVIANRIVSNDEFDAIRLANFPAGPVTAITGEGGVEVGGLGLVVGADNVPPSLSVAGAGGVTVAGEGVVTFLTPGSRVVIGTGGVVVGGRGEIHAGPAPLIIVGSGGVQVGGRGVFSTTSPTASPVLVVVGSGGVVAGGEGAVTFTTLPILSVIGSGGVKVGLWRVPELSGMEFVSPAAIIKTVIGAGGIEAGGTGIVRQVTPIVFAVPFPLAADGACIKVGGDGVLVFLSPQILEIMGDGGVYVGAEISAEDLFETYVLTGSRAEPSIYAPFPFNSYCRFRGSAFGAGQAGIYLLEGQDDAGEPIHPGVRIGPSNFGTDREKRLRLLRCGGITDSAEVKVSNGNGSAGYYSVEGGRAAVSREVQGREITIDITDFETLDHLEIVPTVLHKR